MLVHRRNLQDTSEANSRVVQYMHAEYGANPAINHVLPHSQLSNTMNTRTTEVTNTDSNYSNRGQDIEELHIRGLQ